MEWEIKLAPGMHKEREAKNKTCLHFKLSPFSCLVCSRSWFNSDVPGISCSVLRKLDFLWNGMSDKTCSKNAQGEKPKKNMLARHFKFSPFLAWFAPEVDSILTFSMFWSNSTLTTWYFIHTRLTPKLVCVAPKVDSILTFLFFYIQLWQNFHTRLTPKLVCLLRKLIQFSHFWFWQNFPTWLTPKLVVPSSSTSPCMFTFTRLDAVISLYIIPEKKTWLLGIGH